MDFIRQFLIYDPDNPMFFSRFIFWIFFTLLLAFYSIVYKKNHLRNIYLFFISLFFYYRSGGLFFTLLIFSTITDYFLGWTIYKITTKWKKRIFLGLSIFINLALLGYFKYSYFLTEQLNNLFNLQLEVVNYLSLWSNQLTQSDFDISVIILPVGISFYTFQTLSYTIDVYRNKVKPVKSIIDFGFYVSFFPQLVAGPIVRAAEFVPQLYKKYRLSRKEFGYAAFLILNGLIKKMLISDYISINFVDRVFESPLSYTGFENLMAVYGYGIQIYCDFSGYTDIAIGIALLLGFRLPVNFKSPYKAKNLTDFWRRWHISLSTWLRDYLYISLGGNRKGKARTYINLMITMLLGGLWHGANIRFVIWGAIHGLGLVIHKLWNETIGKRMPAKVIYSLLTGFITFQFVHFAWIFFRAKSMPVVHQMLNQIVYQMGWKLIPDMVQGYDKIFSLILIAFVVHWLPSRVKDGYINVFINTPYWVKVIIAVVVVFIIYQVKSSDIQPFIYFRF